MTKRMTTFRDQDGYTVECCWDEPCTSDRSGSITIQTPEGKSVSCGLTAPTDLDASLSRAVLQKNKQPTEFCQVYNLPVRRSAIAHIRAAVAARDAAVHEDAEPTTHQCDRCKQTFAAAEATFRPGRVGAFKCKLPYCPTCAQFLFETEDGFGETSPSYPPGDSTPYHKEDLDS